MSENKCCGNCKNFKNEDVVGWGICIGFSKEFGVHCSHVDCLSHKTTEKFVNGWTEITPDNVKELCESKRRLCVAFVCNGEVSYMCGQFGITLSTMAKYGGYYYYVLPELKIE